MTGDGEVIRIENLRKEYKPSWPWQSPIQALNGLSLTVRRGEIYGFLGPNGAGKTTTLKILLGLIKPTGGTAHIFGRPAGEVEVRRRLGFLPESPYFYDYLTAEEFLVFYGRMAGLQKADLTGRVATLLDLVGLSEARTRQLRKFSKGMLQRVGLAQALVHDPELVIMDEPMSGLDPIGRKQVRDLILNLRERGKTIFFSTHIIPDVEVMCDRVGIVLRGQLLTEGRVDELVNRASTRSVEIVCEGIAVDSSPAIVAMANRVHQRGHQGLIQLQDPQKVDDVLAAVRAYGGHILSVTPLKGSLEELFFQQAPASPGALSPTGH